MAEGLTRKYEVKHVAGGDVGDAFVLRVQSDPAGWLAAWYYASMTYNRALANDLREWLLNNTPKEEALGSEGALNRSMLTKVQDTVNSPEMPPKE